MQVSRCAGRPTHVPQTGRERQSTTDLRAPSAERAFQAAAPACIHQREERAGPESLRRRVRRRRSAGTRRAPRAPGRCRRGIASMASASRRSRAAAIQRPTWPSPPLLRLTSDIFRNQSGCAANAFATVCSALTRPTCLTSDVFGYLTAIPTLFIGALTPSPVNAPKLRRVGNDGPLGALVGRDATHSSPEAPVSSIANADSKS